MSHLPQRWHNRRIGHGLQLPAWRPRPALPAAPRPARLAALRPPRLVHPRRRRPSRPPARLPGPPRDRKSTRLNSSHITISYAVFCLKKKTKTIIGYSLKIKKKKKI